jgi:hypothetical protein
MAIAVALVIASAPVRAQNMTVAQGVSPESFQFNEMDFDRQGSGQGPAPSRPATSMLGLPGEPAAPGQDPSMTDLFSGGSGTQQGSSIQNLPGVPSPISQPAGPGEARIELANGAPAVAPQSTVCPAPSVCTPPPKRRARRARRRADPKFDNVQDRRFYYAMQAWRNHPEVNPANSSSYVYDRLLYHIRCIRSVAVR